jgi:hypothetical protein
VTLPPVYSTNLTHTETCSCVDTSVLHHQLKQRILKYCTLLRCFNVPFHSNFDYFVLYIWRCEFYYLIELEIVLSRWYCSISSCLDTWRKLPWNYTCLCFVQNCNILTTIKNQYFDYLLYNVFVSGNILFAVRRKNWSNGLRLWLFGHNIKKMSCCLLTSYSYMRTQYFVSFYVVMNVWPVA